MTGGEPIWVCANCRSVNKLRAKQCYNCRTPKDRAAIDPTAVNVMSRTVDLPAFRPSRLYAVVASVLILVIGTVQAINSVAGAMLALRVAEGDSPAEAEIVNLGILGLTTIGIGLIALTAWALWLSKAVRVMPALGLGYPAANGLMAFVENFVPVLNLWRVPAIVRDIVMRLEPNESKGGVLVSVAWIGLIAGYLLPRFGSMVNRLGSGVQEDYVRNQALIQLVSAGLVLAGSVFLVVLIWWIEGRIRARRAAGPAVGSDAPPSQARTTGGIALAAAGMPSAHVQGAAAPAPAPVAPSVMTVPGPLGSVVVVDTDPIVNRPITALTGSLAPTAAMAPEVAAAPPEHELASTPEPAASTLEPAATPSEGPRLQVAIAHDGSMVATLDGESEPITLEGLRAFAKALARVDGSAIVTISDRSPEASASANSALKILTDSHVPATVLA